MLLGMMKAEEGIWGKGNAIFTGTMYKAFSNLKGKFSG
jgi:hypothetical protein